MRLRFWWAVPALLAALFGASSLRADDTADAIRALKKQVEELNQKIQALETRQAQTLAPAPAREESTAVMTVNNDGVNFRSADTNFVVGLHGLLQVDNRTFFHDGGIKGNDGFLLRKARPMLSGTLYRDFDFMFVPDFGGSSAQLFDAYLNYRYAPWLQVQGGKFKVPVGLELLQSDSKTFFNERSLVSDLVPNRDVGFALHGELAGGLVSYSGGVFNGIGDGRISNNMDFDDNREFAGRIFLQPFKQSEWTALQNFGAGLAGSFSSSFDTNTLPSTTGGKLGGYYTEGQQQFFAYNPVPFGTNSAVVTANGDHWRLSPQGYYLWGPFGLIGEYVISAQEVKRSGLTPASAQLQHKAWEISGSWVLTGEDASLNGVTPAHPFAPRDGHWGALQLVARYAELDLDRNTFPAFADPATSASAARTWSAGLNWYLNRNFRLNASFSHTSFSGGGGAGSSAPATVTRQPENVFFTRLQLAF